MQMPMPMPGGIAPPPGGMPLPPGAGAPPGGMPMPPGMMGAAQNLLAALAGRGGGTGGCLPDPMMLFLTFTAGVGFPELVRAIEKMRKLLGGEKGGKGVGADAQRAPMQAIPLQLAQMLAARGAGPQAPAAQALGGLR